MALLSSLFSLLSTLFFFWGVLGEKAKKKKKKDHFICFQSKRVVISADHSILVRMRPLLSLCKLPSRRCATRLVAARALSSPRTAISGVDVIDRTFIYHRFTHPIVILYMFSIATIGLTDDQKTFYNLARRFADDVLAPNAGKWDETSHFPMKEFKRTAELGINAHTNCILSCDL